MPLNILVVDDQAMIRNIHTQMLIDGGHSIQTATNGQEALDCFLQAQKEKPFDLVMTDEEMPVMTGLELARKLYSKVPGLPIVMISSVEDVNLMISLMRMGISFFRKPLRKQDIERFLEATEKQIKINKQREQEQEGHKKVEALVTSTTFTLHLPNDKELSPPVIKYVLDACEANQISEQITFRVHFGLEETLINAMAHGNLEMGSAEFKKEGNFELWETELIRRSEIMPYKDRKVKVHVRIDRGKEVRLMIEDQGKGFNHEAVLAKISADDIYQAYGRGLIMLKGMSDALEYNTKGNCVYMTFIEPEPEDKT
ncbi:response regulator [Deltaproteobacteria bacterium TL4]